MLPERVPNWLSLTRLAVGVVVIIVGVLTQFDVTVKQEVTRPKVVRVEVPPRKLVEKAGTIPEADCYALAKHPDGVTRRKLLDTYGTPKGDEDTISGVLVYPLAEHERRSCTLDFWGGLARVSIDLYDSNGY